MLQQQTYTQAAENALKSMKVSANGIDDIQLAT